MVGVWVSAWTFWGHVLFFKPRGVMGKTWHFYNLILFCVRLAHFYAWLREREISESFPQSLYCILNFDFRFIFRLFLSTFNNSAILYIFHYVNIKLFWVWDSHIVCFLDFLCSLLSKHLLLLNNLKLLYYNLSKVQPYQVFPHKPQVVLPLDLAAQVRKKVLIFPYILLIFQ